jgi:Tfp pilus assembly protein PilW
MKTSHRATGFTLISLLVGVLIGALCIAAMLVLYRTLVGTSGDVIRQANIDGQIATGSLVVQQQLQQAGFGVTGPMPGKDVVVLSNATMANGKVKGDPAGSYNTMVAGNAVVWGYNPSGALKTFDATAYMCEGVMATSDGLLWLTPQTCSGADQWQGLTWKWTLLATAKSVGNVSSFQASPATCWPYGQTTAVSTLQVSYFLEPQIASSSSAPAPSSTSAAAVFNAIPVFSVCMPNFRTGTS